MEKSGNFSFTTPSNIKVIVVKLSGRGQQGRIHLFVFHHIIDVSY